MSKEKQGLNRKTTLLVIAFSYVMVAFLSMI